MQLKRQYLLEEEKRNIILNICLLIWIVNNIFSLTEVSVNKWSQEGKRASLLVYVAIKVLKEDR